MKKIRFLINTLKGGGAERVLVNLLNRIPQELFEVSLVTVSGGVFANDLPDYVKHYQIVRGDSLLSKIKEKLIKLVVFVSIQMLCHKQT